MRPCVLVVEDIEINRAVARLYLEDIGFAVFEAASGVRALSAFAHREFHAVLLDLCMPDMDGFTVATLLRQREAELGRPRARIVAITAMPVESIQERCLSCGFDRVAAKPVSRDDLLALLS